MISYSATLDVSGDLAVHVSLLLAARRRRVGTRRGSRALTCWPQTVLLLRWFRDGTLVSCDRVTDPHRASDRWYSGKHHHHGGNVQVLADPTGRPLWTSPVETGSVHDLTAAREHALPVLYPAAANGLPTLADKGDTGAGAGIRIPVKRLTGGQVLDPATRGWNSYVNTDRAPVERAIATLKVRWRTLKHLTLCPQRIGHITAAALVLTCTEQHYSERVIVSRPG